MQFDRRTVLQSGGLAAALAGLPRSALFAQPVPDVRPVDPQRIYIPETAPAAHPLDLLILGGTVFVGPAVVKAALARGHKVTLFNRGQSNPALFPDLPRLRGDRTIEDGLSSLRGRRFDAVIDTWAGAPRAVDKATAYLAPNVGHYVYVSTISVYDRLTWSRQDRVDEISPRRSARPGVDPRNPDEEYGVRKRMAEDYARSSLGDRLTIVRPHQILGFHIDRASASQRHWPMRFLRGGDILVPGDGEDRTQFIDVGDLAAFIVRAAEEKRVGTFNTMRTLTWRAFTESLAPLSPSPPKLHWVSYEGLAAAGVRPASDMPQWVPRQRGPGFMGHDASKAIAAGLSFRPDADLWRDIIAGTAELYPNGYTTPTTGPDRPITLEREQELLTLFA